jgi:hypothetical protein
MLLEPSYLLLSLGRVGGGKRLSLLGLLDLGRLLSSGFVCGFERREKRREKERTMRKQTLTSRRHHIDSCASLALARARAA